MEIRKDERDLGLFCYLHVEKLFSLMGFLRKTLHETVIVGVRVQELLRIETRERYLRGDTGRRFANIRSNSSCTM